MAERTINELSEITIGAAIEVHRALGPGLLESAYEECLCRELSIQQIDFQRQYALPVEYKGVKLDCGYVGPNRDFTQFEQSSTFLKPVYLGDTLYPMLVLSELKPQRTTGVVTLRATVHNQREELCIEGYQKYLVRRRNPAS